MALVYVTVEIDWLDLASNLRQPHPLTTVGTQRDVSIIFKFVPQTFYSRSDPHSLFLCDNKKYAITSTTAISGYSYRKVANI